MAAIRRVRTRPLQAAHSTYSCFACIARRLSTVASFYRYCVEEELIGLSPAVNVRRPKVRPESTMTGLDRNQLGLFLVEAGLSNARDHALACLLSLNGLRVSEALGADIGDMGLERGHHTLRITRKGGKAALAPLAPSTARTVYLAVGDREDGPTFLLDVRILRVDDHHGLDRQRPRV
jgi:integrase/recombinase XerD